MLSKSHRQNAIYLISFLWNSRKGKWQRAHQWLPGAEGDLKKNTYLDCVGSFVTIPIYQNSPNWTLIMGTFYLNKVVKKISQTNFPKWMFWFYFFTTQITLHKQRESTGCSTSFHLVLSVLFYSCGYALWLNLHFNDD